MRDGEIFAEFAFKFLLHIIRENIFSTGKKSFDLRVMLGNKFNDEGFANSMKKVSDFLKR